ncbi:hypothetical protein HanPI659440_Chr01g0023881 [Helianthus annuus]|nr:hypothetical protein HanPI659440_Chr01g0023881 [Helianthus annuus]
MYAYINACMYVGVYDCMYVCRNVCMYECKLLCVYVGMASYVRVLLFTNNVLEIGMQCRNENVSSRGVEAEFVTREFKRIVE